MHLSRFLQLMEDDMEGSPITLRALLPTKKAGALIGIQRNIQYQLQERHGVHIHFHMDIDEFGRLVSVVGRLDNVSRFWREAMILLFSSGHRLNYGEKLGINFLIPLALSSKLQNGPLSTRPEGSQHRGRCALAEITQLSGVTLLLKSDVLPNTTEQVLQVSIENLDRQRLDGFEQAIQMLGDCFQKNRREAFSPRNIYYVPYIAEQPPCFDVEKAEEEEEEEELSVEEQWVTNLYDIQFCPDELQDDQWHNDFCPDGFQNAQWLDDLSTNDKSTSSTCDDYI